MFAYLLGALLGCAPENTVVEIPIDAIAVAAGDYDRVEEVLLRGLVNYQLYEGYIVGASYDETIEADDIVLEVEDLLKEDELETFGAVFVNSGTRGLGEYVYNGIERDDGLVSDEQVIAAVSDWVSGGGVLVVSDWAYDLVEACWPDAIEFVGDETLLDDAQRGSRGSVSATVREAGLQETLGETVIALEYDFSHWALIDSVADHVQIHLSGDAVYRASEAEGEVTLRDLPLLVSFESGNGQVVFSTFHWRVQNNFVADSLLFSVVDGLYEGAGEEQGDTGE